MEPKFSEELVKWRKDHKLYQKQVADFIGVEFQTYLNWEYGRSIPTEFVKNQVRKILQGPPPGSLIKTLQ